MEFWFFDEGGSWIPAFAGMTMKGGNDEGF
jgi:hypothetical protein